MNMVWYLHGMASPARTKLWDAVRTHSVSLYCEQRAEARLMTGKYTVPNIAATFVGSVRLERVSSPERWSSKCNWTVCDYILWDITATRFCRTLKGPILHNTQAHIAYIANESQHDLRTYVFFLSSLVLFFIVIMLVNSVCSLCSLLSLSLYFPMWSAFFSFLSLFHWNYGAYCTYVWMFDCAFFLHTFAYTATHYGNWDLVLLRLLLQRPMLLRIEERSSKHRMSNSLHDIFT